MIIYADNLSDIDLRPLIAFHRWHGDPMTMVLFRAPKPRAVPAGSPSWTREGRIVSFFEKPDQPTSDLANARTLRRGCRGLPRDRRDGGRST